MSRVGSVTEEQVSRTLARMGTDWQQVASYYGLDDSFRYGPGQQLEYAELYQASLKIDEAFTESDRSLLSQGLCLLLAQKEAAFKDSAGITLPGGRALEARDFGIPEIKALLTKLDGPEAPAVDATMADLIESAIEEGGEYDRLAFEVKPNEETGMFDLVVVLDDERRVDAAVAFNSQAEFDRALDELNERFEASPPGLRP